jgi:hypothetical protein
MWQIAAPPGSIPVIHEGLFPGAFKSACAAVILQALYNHHMLARRGKTRLNLTSACFFCLETNYIFCKVFHKIRKYHACVREAISLTEKLFLYR